MAIVACDAVKDLRRVCESASYVSTFAGDRKENVFEGSLTTDLDSTALPAHVLEGATGILVFRKQHVDEAIVCVPEVHSMVWMQLFIRVCQIEMFHVAMEGPEEAEVPRGPLLAHVCLDARPEECVSILVGGNEGVTVVVLHGQLNGHPLVVREVEGLRHALIVVLTGEEEDPRRVAPH